MFTFVATTAKTVTDTAKATHSTFVRRVLRPHELLLWIRLPLLLLLIRRLGL